MRWSDRDFVYGEPLRYSVASLYRPLKLPLQANTEAHVKEPLCAPFPWIPTFYTSNVHTPFVNNTHNGKFIVSSISSIIDKNHYVDHHLKTFDMIYVHFRSVLEGQDGYSVVGTRQFINGNGKWTALT